MFAARSYKNYGVSSVTDPFFRNTSLLLHGDGTNGAQNNTFLDSSSNNFTITRNGTPTQGSFTPYGNLWSNSFDGTGDYLTAPDNNNFSFGTGDFTVECWIYLNAINRVNGIWTNGPATTGAFGFYVLSNNKLEVSYYFGATLQGSTSLTSATWYHVAVTRSSNTTRLFLNGIQEAINTSVFNNTTNKCSVGNSFTNQSDSLNGYISNLRIVKGTAVYTSTFTPPTSPLTAIAGTSLLTCQSNRFRDNSSNNFALTVNGNVSVSTEAPFNPTSEYSITTDGGSGYFPGVNSNYLSVPSNAGFNFSSGTFTVECFVNFTNLSVSSQKIAGNYNSSTTGWSFGVDLNKLYFNSSGDGSDIIGTTSLVINTWYHVAVSGSAGSYKLFLNGVQDGSTYTGATSLAGGNLGIGAIGDRSGFIGTVPVNGYISNLRITNGRACYTSNFTPPTSPVTLTSNGGATPSTAPTSSQVSLLCDFTNAGIFDNTKKNNLVTVGNAQISTSVKKYGTGSMYFDGTGDYLESPISSLWSFPANTTFTFECWINTPQKSDETNCILSIYNTTKNDQFVVRTRAGKLEVYTNNGAPSNSVGTIPVNTWTHIAVSGTLPNLKAFINGQEYNITLNSSFTVGGAKCVVGGMLVSDSTKFYYYIGYIDDLRITKGVARYTANFTPPTQAFPNL